MLFVCDVYCNYVATYILYIQMCMYIQVLLYVRILFFSLMKYTSGMLRIVGERTLEHVVEKDALAIDSARYTYVCSRAPRLCGSRDATSLALYSRLW